MLCTSSLEKWKDNASNSFTTANATDICINYFWWIPSNPWEWTEKCVGVGGGKTHSNFAQLLAYPSLLTLFDIDFAPKANMKGWKRTELFCFQCYFNPLWSFTKAEPAPVFLFRVFFLSRFCWCNGRWQFFLKSNVSKCKKKTDLTVSNYICSALGSFIICLATSNLQKLCIDE